MLRSVGNVIRRRPKTTALVVVFLALAGTGGGLYAYLLRQLHEAEAAVKEGRLDEARDKLALSLRVWPWSRSPRVHLLAARAARLRGDFADAEAHLNRCKELEHRASDAVKLEFLLMRVQGGEVDEVVSELLQYAENERSEAPMILETLARAYLNNLRYGPALYCLDRWVQVAPEAAEPHHLRGLVRERIQNPKGAVEDYTEALKHNPDLFWTRLRLAEVGLEHHKPFEALPHLERLHKQAPNRPEVQARLGECRFLQGRAREARRLLEAAAAKLPWDPSVFNHLAQLELQQEQPLRAERWLKRALKADPTDPESLFTLERCLRMQGRTKDADEALAKHKEIQDLLKKVNRLLRDETEHRRADAKTAFEIGSLMLRIKPSAGRYWIDEALRRDPNYQPALQARAEYAKQQKQGKSAPPLPAGIPPGPRAEQTGNPAPR